MELTGKVAVVTGAAGNVGRAVVRLLRGRGATVVEVTRATCDLADRAAVTALPGRIAQEHGPIDILVNVAGVHHRGDFESLNAAQIAQMCDVDLLAPILLAHAALPSLRAVVNIASLAAKAPVPGDAVYAAAKAGLRAWGRALDEELAARGVRVHTICPGPIDGDSI